MTEHDYNFKGLELFFQEMSKFYLKENDDDDNDDNEKITSDTLALDYENMCRWEYTEKESKQTDTRMLAFMGKIFSSRKYMKIDDTFLLYLEIKCATLADEKIIFMSSEMDKFIVEETNSWKSYAEMAGLVFDFINNPIIEDFMTINYTTLLEWFSDSQMYDDILKSTSERVYLRFVRNFTKLFYTANYIYRMVYWISSELVVPVDLPFRKDFTIRFKFADDTLVSKYNNFLREYASLRFLRDHDANYSIMHLIYYQPVNIHKMGVEILQETNYDFQEDKYNVALYGKSKFYFEKECLELDSQVIEPVFLLFNTFDNICQVSEFIETFEYTEKVDEQLWKDFTNFHQKIANLLPFSQKKIHRMKKFLKSYNVNKNAYNAIQTLEDILSRF